MIMYYILFIMLYALLLYLFKISVKYSVKEESSFSKSKLINETLKGLSKRDVKYRRKRIKALPFYKRFLYKAWYISVIFLLIILPVLLCAIRRLIIKALIPTYVTYFETDILATSVFLIGGLLIGVPITLVYSYLTNRGIIKQADLIYQLGSFQEYPKKVNIILSWLCVLIGLLIVFLPCNCYRYCTDDKIGIKKVFSLSEQAYTYPEINYVEKVISGSEAVKSRYTFFTQDGESFILGENVTGDVIDNLLCEKDIEVYVKSKT